MALGKYPLKKLFVVNWRLIALKHCVGFCHISLWISHRYTYVPLLLNLPSTSHPILPSRLSQSTRFEHPTSYSKFPLAIKFYPWQCVCFSATPAGRPTLSFPLCVHSLFSMSVSHSVQFSSVTQSCPTLCDPMNRSTPGLPVHHQLPESTQTHVHWVGDAIQPSHPLSSPSLPDLNLSQHHSLLKWVSSLQKVAKVLEFQLQHKSHQ